MKRGGGREKKEFSNRLSFSCPVKRRSRKRERQSRSLYLFLFSYRRRKKKKRVAELRDSPVVLH